MGFFSWDCKGCGHSVRHGGATNADSRWMSAAVLLTPDGSTVKGEYDGYGRVGCYDHGEDGGAGDPALYHESCWKLLKRPGYDGPSPSADDQGHFVGDVDPPEPRTRKDVERLAAEAAKRREDAAREWREHRAKRRQELLDKGEPVPEWLQEDGRCP